MLLNDNYLFKQFNDCLFNYPVEVTLTNDLPEYLFKLKKLSINTDDKDCDCNVLQKFTNLKTLKAYILSGTYLLNLRTNLEEVDISRFCDLNESSFLNLKHLKILSVDSLNGTENEWLKQLENLTKLEVYNFNFSKNECLQHFTKLLNLKILDSSIKDDNLTMLKNLTKLKPQRM
ncbi:hypothetical protein ABK040_004318 [Willaertia magna]